MANLAPLQQPVSVRDQDSGARVVAAPQPLYFAFLSYSHSDSAMADWLHKELERFVVPHSLSGRLTKNGVIPKRLAPIFRDRGELAASDDLGAEIRDALAASRFLVVLCSPAAAKSRWTNAEIDSFKRLRPDGCVLAAITDGEPFATDVPGREDEECLPPALKVHYDRRGRPTTKRAEPLAADLRDSGDGKRLGLLKLVAGMLGVGLDQLVQRETRRRQRRLAMLAAASLGGMVVTSGLAVVAIEARDAARDQRREAEGLVSFMLGDLRSKLEPIGRLDALDGVGSRVLAYYQKQDTSDLSDAALSQRSRALSLMADVASRRDNLDSALRLYREAAAGTAEAIRRNPNDPQRIFDHAQNIFYAGEIASQLGNGSDAETAMREYRRLALRMVALDPNNMKWRMEVQNADANLGVVLYQQRRFADAVAQFDQALNSIEAFATADPTNREYQKSLAEGLAWMADAHMSEGQLERAIGERNRHVALLRRLLALTNDVYYGLRLVSAETKLGNLYAMRGQLDLAIQHLGAAVDQANRLNAIEPSNNKWHEFAFKAQLGLAQYLLFAGKADEAAKQARAGCDTVEQLIGKDSRMPEWRAGLRDCWILRTQLALAGAVGEALQSAQQAVVVAQSVKSSDAAADKFALAKSYRLLGDVQRRFGDTQAAVAAWTNAVTVIPSDVAERPSEMHQHALVLQRLGRNGQALQLDGKLRAIGYREPEFGTS